MVDRLNSSPDKSYVSSLYEKGNNYMSGKVLEEANELIEAIRERAKKKKGTIHYCLFFDCASL